RHRCGQGVGSLVHPFTIASRIAFLQRSGGVLRLKSIGARDLGIPSSAMSRLKECRQQGDDLQETPRGQLYRSLTYSKQPLLHEAGEAFSEIFQDIRPELAAEISHLEVARFQLQDHLADQQLAWCYG